MLRTLAIAALAAALCPAFADGPIAVGGAAPAFELANQLDKKVSLASFKDKRWVLIAFYPKVGTPG